MERSIQTPALNVGYEESGNASGFPVILLHGFPDDVHAYDDVAPPLTNAGFRVLVPYLRGYGRTSFREAQAPRMAETYPGCRGWADLVERAADDPNVWVVQELVAPVPARHLLVAGGAPEWHDVFVDINAYACLGVDARPRGGVCRASSSKIVNIAGGGGVAPLVTRSVLEALDSTSPG